MRGANVRQRTTGTDFLTAIIGLVGRNKRRYGGYIVHLGIVLIFLGFAGNGFKRDTQVSLKPGEQTTIGSFTVRNDGLKVYDDGQKRMVTGYISVFQHGKQIDTLYPARWFYRKHETNRRRRSRFGGALPKISISSSRWTRKASRPSRRTWRFTSIRS